MHIVRPTNPPSMTVLVDTILFGDVEIYLIPADLDLPRIDLIVAYPGTSGRLRDGYISAISGTPAKDPLQPAIPLSGRILAKIMVNRAQTSIEQLHISEVL
jgi:hypothetical protein